MNYSSSIAFYTIFSLPAILLIILSVAGSAYESQLVQQNLLEQVQLLFGPESASIIDDVLANAEGLGSSWITRIISIGTLVFSATTVFVSLQGGLNYIWGIKPKPQKGLLNFIIGRLISIALVISMGFLIIVSLLLDTALAIFKDRLTDWLSGYTYSVVTILNGVLSIAILTLIFALIFKVLPDVRIHWKDVWVGAIITTILLVLGKYLIGYYLGNNSLGTTYGAAGSLVLLLLWVYYSSTILLLGATFTYEYSKVKGHQIRPDKYAVVIKEVEKPDSDVFEE